MSVEAIKYTCKIIPSIENTQMENDFSSPSVLAKKSVLQKWFYFYMNTPDHPVYVREHESSYIIHPGTNRYIGTALRDDNSELDCILLSLGSHQTMSEIHSLNQQLLHRIQKYVVHS